MPKKTTKKKASPKRKPSARGTPWHTALFNTIASDVIRPHLSFILTGPGVTSKSDFRRQFMERLSCTISTEDFDAALQVCGYKDLFTKRTLISLSGANPQGFRLPESPEPRDAPGQLGLNGKPIGPGNRDGFSGVGTLPAVEEGDVDPANAGKPGYDDLGRPLVNISSVPLNEQPGFVSPEARAVEPSLLGFPPDSPSSRSDGSRVFSLPNG